ncbi:MAG: biotin attachment protein, partial [Tissierellia bacterium]|nr:biotin attachment protein [Tissierellia bacterium]
VESLDKGKLKKIHFEEGDSIKVDETVAEIEIDE